MRSFLAVLSVVTVATDQVSADIIATFDFSDAIWDVQVTEFGSPVDDGSGVVLGGTGLEADRTGGAGGSIYVNATLTGSISTSGFENIALEFTSDGSSQTAWDAGTVFGSTTGDGFRVMSGQGVDFDTRGAGTAFETLLDGFGTSWTPATAAGQTPGPTDLEFDASVNNGSVTDLTFELQVNSSNDFVRLRTVMLTGDMITVGVPEPSVIAVLALITVGVIGRVQRRWPFSSHRHAESCPD